MCLPRAFREGFNYSETRPFGKGVKADIELSSKSFPPTANITNLPEWAHSMSDSLWIIFRFKPDETHPIMLVSAEMSISVEGKPMLGLYQKVFTYKSRNVDEIIDLVWKHFRGETLPSASA